MPTRHGGSFSKNASTCRRFNWRRITAWPPASTPWTWKTDLAMSRPIVATVCIACSSESWELLTAPTSVALTCRWRSRPQHQLRTWTTNGLTGEGSRPSRQENPDLREFARLCVDLDRAAVLLYDDVMTDGKAQTGAFSGRLGRKKRIENLFLHIRLNSGAVIADPDLHAVVKVLR